jgi:hypothetical protein
MWISPHSGYIPSGLVLKGFVPSGLVLKGFVPPGLVHEVDYKFLRCNCKFSAVTLSQQIPRFQILQHSHLLNSQLV